MSKFTIAQLSKKYGIARTSIYDRMKNGTISYEIDAKNRKVIDLSEMQRVYGKAESKANSKSTDNNLTELYKQLIDELRYDKRIAEEREKHFYKEIEQLKDKIDNLTLALGYKTQNIQDNSKPYNTDEQYNVDIDVQDMSLSLPKARESEYKKRGFLSRLTKAILNK